MDVLVLIAWIIGVLAILAAAVKWRPEHPNWNKVDIAYYTLALIGVVLFFLTGTRDRTIARAVDTQNMHAQSLDNIKRYAPAFTFPNGDPVVSDAAMELLKVKAVAETCKSAERPDQACAKAQEQSYAIEAAFGALTEPPMEPAQARAYAIAFCGGVERLGRKVTSDDRGDPSIRRLLQSDLAALTLDPHPDRERLTRMRRAIRLAGPQASTLEPEANFALAVLYAAAACPPDLPPAQMVDRQMRDWKRNFDRHTLAQKQAIEVLSQATAADPLQFGGEGGASLTAFVRGLWPFFVSLALGLKLAKTVRDERKPKCACPCAARPAGALPPSGPSGAD